LWYRYHQWLSDIELIQMSAFSASHTRINSCFTAGKRIGVQNCHATCGHGKMSIFTSIVYVPDWGSSFYYDYFFGYQPNARKFDIVLIKRIVRKRKNRIMEVWTKGRWRYWRQEQTAWR
jgi:hypothetical protein